MAQVQDNECPICHSEMVLPTAIPACNHTFCFICIKGVTMMDSPGCPICRGPIDERVLKTTMMTSDDLKMGIPDSPVPGMPPVKRMRVEAPQQPQSQGTTSTATGQAVVKDEPVDKELAEDVKPDVAALNAQMDNNNAQVQAEKKVQEGKRVQAHYWLYKGRHQGWWRFDPRTEKDVEDAKVNGLPITEVFICGHLYVVDFDNMIQYRKDQGDRFHRELRRVTSDEFDALNVKGVAGVLVR